MTHSLAEEAIRPAALMTDKADRLESDRRFLLERRERWVPVSCPSCSTDDPAPFATKDTIEYQRCRNCSTVYTNPRPSESLLSEFYGQSQNYAYWNEHIFPATEQARRERIFAPRAERTMRLLEKHGVDVHTAIEVGAAFGTFCEEIRSRNIAQRIIAIEPTPALASTCRARGFETIQNTIEHIDLPCTAELVCAFEVIEHLFDPKAFVERCAGFLRPGGLLLLSCPNVRGFDIAQLGIKSGAFDHEHLNYFHPDALAHLVRSVGLECVETLTPGLLDADLVRQAVLRGHHDIADQPLLRDVLVDHWEDRGDAFQSFLASHGLSSHLWIAAKKPKARALVTKPELAKDQRVFTRWLDDLDAQRRTPSLDDLSHAHHELDIVQQLQSSGIARWDGFLPDDQLRALASEARSIIDRAAVISNTLPPSGRGRDEANGADVWRGMNPHDGRTRANFSRESIESMPNAVRSLFDDERMSRIVRTYYNAERAWCNALLVERLAESRTADTWHFDKLFDQIKVMILLSDTTEDNGPLRYKAGSHHRPPELDLFFHRSFAGGPIDGLDFNYPPRPLVEKLPGESVLGTGRAGDAIFFDTLGIHSGTLCWSGQRLALVAAFNVATPRNDALYALFFPKSPAPRADTKK